MRRWWTGHESRDSNCERKERELIDIMTILGLTIGIGAVFVGYVGEGGDSVWVLLHPFAWIIVFGGAFGCGLIGLPMAHGKHVLKTALSGRAPSAVKSLQQKRQPMERP